MGLAKFLVNDEPESTLSDLCWMIAVAGIERWTHGQRGCQQQQQALAPSQSLIHACISKRPGTAAALSASHPKRVG